MNNFFADHERQYFVASKYYEENWSQERIANTIGVSRPTVSKILKQCLEDGIVTITVNAKPNQFRHIKECIREKYHLRDVIVVESKDDPETNKAAVANAAAKYLSMIARTGDLVGISSGTTILKMLDYLDQYVSTRADTIQLSGCGSTNAVATNTTYITFEFARALGGGNAHIMRAPISVQTKVLHDLLLEEPAMRDHYRLFKKMNHVFSGVSGISDLPEARFNLSGISMIDYDRALESGAVASFCGYMLDKDGNPVTGLDGYNDRVISVPLQDLKQTENTLIAAGKFKKDAIIAAIKGGYVTNLIIDNDIAVEMIGIDD